MPDYRLSFRGLKEEKGTIAIPLLVDKLELLQNLNYIIGEYNENRPFKVANIGARRKSTLNQYTLILKELRKGSTEAIISPMSNQSFFDIDDTQFNPTTKGAASLETIHDLIGHIASEKNPSQYLEEKIRDSKFRDRIGRLLLELYPKEEDQYSIDFINSSGVSFSLEGNQRSHAKKMIDDNFIEEKETLFCPILSIIYEADQNGMKSFKTSIDGKKLTILVSSEIFDQVEENSGRLVEIECNNKLNINGDITGVYDVTKIKRVEFLELWDISFRNREYRLVKPLKVKIESDIKRENEWFLINEDLGIMSVDNDWESAFNAFNEEFDVFVHEYVKTKDNLNPGAIKLKEKILGYLGWSI